MKKQDSLKRKNSMGTRQRWENCDRRSMENIGIANGWLKNGYTDIAEKSIFFNQVYCID